MISLYWTFKVLLSYPKIKKNVYHIQYSLTLIIEPICLTYCDSVAIISLKVFQALKYSFGKFGGGCKS